MAKTNEKIKTVFIGTPDFALPSFRALYNDGLIKILAAVAQPDKKSGRGQKLNAPPIKKEAQKYNIPIWQPKKITSIADKIKSLKPDIIIVIAYAQLIPKQILNLPKYGCLNVHGSLLPKYRGASCVQAPILRGDKKTGITIMRMNAGLDTGPIIAQNELIIKPSDTAGSLSQKLSLMAAQMLIPAIKKYIAGEISLVPQNQNQASYAKSLCKADGRIDWDNPAEYIERFVRAMSPWPGAFSYTENSKIIKIIETQHIPIPVNNHKTGELFLYENKLAVQCGQNSLIITRLQMAGKKIINTQDFLRGYKNLIGSSLDNLPPAKAVSS